MPRRVMTIAPDDDWVQVSNRPAIITVTGIAAQAGSQILFNDAQSEEGAERVTSYNLYQQLIQPEEKITYAKVIKDTLEIIIDD